MKAVRPQREARQPASRANRRGAVSSAMEEILILSLMLPASWVFYQFVTWWARVLFHVIAPLVQWAYL